ncbi:hypothetical protein [Clostridium thermarum]|uniref:hypothetical protein n=1 Tax=Clostridium thermarum TaxID=1716543 RepID=UPI0013D285DD|nr:hypothetical protein [Clostridium thermarum]
MDNIIDMDSLFLYREAAKRLEKSNIGYEKLKLLNDPELCREIIVLMDIFKAEEREL